MGKKILLLNLKVGDRLLNLELAPQTKLVLGRGPSADIHIDDPSVSSEHLKLEYNGTALRVSDMSSTNGTYRMPSVAPFAEAEFSFAAQSIELRLGLDAVVSLDWLLKPDSGKGGEFTKTAIEESVSPSPTKDMAPEAPRKNLEPTSTVSVKAVLGSERHHFSVYFKTFALLVYSASILAFSRTLWFGDLGFVERMQPEQRGLGLGIDILAISMEGYSQRGWFLVALSILLFYGFFRFWIKALKHPPFRMALVAWAVVVSLWPLVYPGVLAVRSGVRMVHYKALRTSQSILESSAFTVDEKAQKFQELLPSLKNSSFFYASVINLFFDRVIDECGGSWKDDWNKKKLCMVLINSVAAEALSNLQPQALMPIAQRLVIITALDSIMRVFSVEGSGSEINTVFLKSMESVGQAPEANRIREILNSNVSGNEKLASLQKLKISVELRMDALNFELLVPDVMRVHPPDLLALGI